MRQRALAFAIFFLLLNSSSYAPPPEPPVRFDFARKSVDFFELKVPTKTGVERFGLTIFDIQEQEFHHEVGRPLGVSLQDEKSRSRIRLDLLFIVRDWWDNHLSGGDLSTLAPGFLESLHTEHSLFLGRNTILVLSHPEDFSQIYAMVRVAKPSLTVPDFPVQRQFKGRLKPFPESPLIKVPDNRIRIYSFRYPDPIAVDIQNLVVYTGDIIELKHYGAVLRRGINLTALLFHAGQEQGIFSISRVERGRALNLPSFEVLITPRFVVAESDNPGVISLLRDRSGFLEHQTFPGAIHPEKETQVLLGTLDQFNHGFHHYHAGRRHSEQLPNVEITHREDVEFLTPYLGAVGCTELIANSLSQFHIASQARLRATVREVEILKWAGYPTH